MAPAVLVLHRHEFEPLGWSLGNCSTCGQTGAASVERLLKKTSLYLIPVAQADLGIIYRCDFCGRAMETAVASTWVPRAEWTATAGVRSLCERLDVEYQDYFDGITDQRLRSLLSSAQEQRERIQVDITPGLQRGAIVGLVHGVALVGVIFAANLLGPDANTGKLIGLTIVGALAGAAIGCILGAIAWSALSNPPILRDVIAETHGKYPLNLARLAVVANDFSPAMQWAVREVDAQHGR